VILDTSAILAVLLQGPGHEQLVSWLGARTTAAIGVPTLGEAGIVLGARLGLAGKMLFARFAQEADLTVPPFTDQHWPLAIDAYLRFGKGWHPAALNFGDRLTYATCRTAGRPLLCVGDDLLRPTWNSSGKAARSLARKEP
jgi:ribonuclease VapC